MQINMISERLKSAVIKIWKFLAFTLPNIEADLKVGTSSLELWLTVMKRSTIDDPTKGVRCAMERSVLILRTRLSSTFGLCRISSWRADDLDQRVRTSETLDSRPQRNFHASTNIFQWSSHIINFGVGLPPTHALLIVHSLMVVWDQQTVPNTHFS